MMMITKRRPDFIMTNICTNGFKLIDRIAQMDDNRMSVAIPRRNRTEQAPYDSHWSP
jgi:hypothetical protein